MGAPEPPLIRAARATDADAIGTLVADALVDKVAPAFGDLGAVAIAALVRRDVARESVRYLVADDGGVAGTARLALAQDVGEGIGPLAAEIGWPRAIRAAFVLGLLTHRRLAPDEAYIEEFAVRADRRRQGIGTALLAACDAHARDAGKRRVTLWVAAGNAPALALYRAGGYAVVSRRGTLRGRLVFNAPVALLMANELVPGP